MMVPFNEMDRERRIFKVLGMLQRDVRWTDIKSGVQEVMCARDLHLGVLSIYVTFKDFLKGYGERSIPTFRNQVEKEKNMQRRPSKSN